MSICTWMRGCCAPALCCALGIQAETGLAQNAAPDSSQSTTDSGTITREEFERRIEEINKRHEADLVERDKAIEELRKELTSRPAESRPSWADEQRSAESQRVINNLMNQIDSDAAANATQRFPVSFNPDLAVVVDSLFSASSDSRNDARNRFDVREAELDLRAAVDPRADGVVVLAFPRDVDNPIFPDGEPAEGPETGAEIEEAYLLFHDFGVPNLTAKLGRFHVRFGRQNILHLHDLPTSDPALVNQSFLAPEALSDAGLSLSYLIPNPWDAYLEADVEILAGEGASSESPVLRGDVSVDSPATNVHLLWNTDIGQNWNMEVGASWLQGQASSDNGEDADLFGGDFTLIRTDPTGGFNNLLIQGEFIHGIVDQPGGSGTERAWGAYVLAQQQFTKDWYAGMRLDWTEDANDASKEAWAVEPYVSWYWSEFLRFRLSYQHIDGDRDPEEVVMLQVTWIFGAHPPHPYWAMK
ncbi:MAG TPA: hypothetical protein VG711_00745 [Phycisphaerales bacterium]|nr:hypothetical protein [Phycisphaerales bacterium]